MTTEPNTKVFASHAVIYRNGPNVLAVLRGRDNIPVSVLRYTTSVRLSHRKVVDKAFELSGVTPTYDLRYRWETVDAGRIPSIEASERSALEHGTQGLYATKL